MKQLGVEIAGGVRRLAVKDGGLTVGCCCSGGGPCCDFTCLHPQCVTNATSGYRCCELGSSYNLQLSANASRNVSITRPIKLADDVETLPGDFLSEFTANLNLYVRCLGPGQRSYTADGFFRSRRVERPQYRRCSTGEFFAGNNDLVIDLEGMEAIDAIFGRAIGMASPQGMAEILGTQTFIETAADDAYRFPIESCSGLRTFGGVLNPAGTIRDRGTHSWDHSPGCLQRRASYAVSRTIAGYSCADDGANPPTDSVYVTAQGTFTMNITRLERCAVDPCTPFPCPGDPGLAEAGDSGGCAGCGNGVGL